MSAQLKFADAIEQELPWMRAQIKELRVRDVNDRHLRKFWMLCDGDPRMTVEAIRWIAGGFTFEPLRARLNP